MRIGTTRPVGIYILSDPISSIAKKFPDLKISLLTQGRTVTYERLQQGAVDLAVVLTEVCAKRIYCQAAEICPRLGHRCRIIIA